MVGNGAIPEKKCGPIFSLFLTLGCFGAVAVLVGRLGLGYAYILAAAVFAGNCLLGLLVYRRNMAMKEAFSQAQLEARAVQQKSHADFISCLSRLS